MPVGRTTIEAGLVIHVTLPCPVVVRANMGYVVDVFKEKDKANNLLKYGIRMCQGKCCKCPDNIRLSFILHLKDDLAGMGAKWQVKCLEYHLHKAFGLYEHPQRDGRCLK